MRRGTDGGVATAEVSTWRWWLSRGGGWPSGRLRRLGARIKANVDGAVNIQGDEVAAGVVLQGAEPQWCVNTIGGELSLVEAEMVVEDLDTDGDGLLGLEGFMRLVDEVGDEDRMKDLKEAFKMYEMEAGCGLLPQKVWRGCLVD
ncbi:ribulose-phosphate 3-epimerase [Hibiscus syriacus]|uniref:Ribulose-phosphate 3-epimerase n=1 Tax=Hibiscus syriacus TaxID=106335 RepID=A0A6A3ATN3_HIBSY|nr:ribulose-phosphate 3-epimerase [Hibiscus syriacus]